MVASSEKQLDEMEAEAAAWAAKLDAAPDADLSGFDDWVGRDERHAGALLRARATLALFDREEEENEEQTRGRIRPALKRFAMWGGGLAAIAASWIAFVVIGSLGDTYATRLGEVRSLALSDGSSVAIDAMSRIEVDFDKTNRDVHLESGKVHFRASHHPDRPFRVLVDNIVITDIGTAFLVVDDDREDEVEVLVTEGAVRVDAPTGRFELVAGQAARFSKSASAGSETVPTWVDAGDIARALAWRDGRIELKGETLSSAIAELNRHNQVKLRVTEPELGNKSLYGSFRMDDVEGFARAVSTSLGAEIHPDSEGIVIGPKKKHAGP